jgi:hypothetical protein
LGKLIVKFLYSSIENLRFDKCKNIIEKLDMLENYVTNEIKSLEEKPKDIGTPLLGPNEKPSAKPKTPMLLNRVKSESSKAQIKPKVHTKHLK